MACEFQYTLSVVVPSYNVAPYITAAVESALDQTLTDLEVLVVDDSTDETTTILQQIAQRRSDPRLKILKGSAASKGSAGGLASARNVGIRAARGKYIGFLDGDDIWRLDKAEKHIAVLEADPTIAITWSNSEYTNEEGKPAGRFLLADVAEPTLLDLARRNQIGNGSSAIVRRDCFERAGLFCDELRSSEDWDMWCRILAVGMRARDAGEAVAYRAKLIPELLTYYRERHTALTYASKHIHVKYARVTVARMREAIPEIPAAAFRQGLAEAIRVAALRAASQDAKLIATKYLLMALYEYPKLTTNWRTLGTMAAIVMPLSMRSRMGRWISDKRMARAR